jgi:hypothetical protein
MTNSSVSGSTLVLTNNGYLKISDLVGRKIIIWDGYKWIPDIKPKKNNEYKKLMHIDFKSGLFINCTEQQKFLIQSKDYLWSNEIKELNAKELNINDRLIPYCFPVIESSQISNDNCDNLFIQGFYAGDGKLSANIFHKNIKLLTNSSILNLKYKVPGIKIPIKGRLSWLTGLFDAEGQTFYEEYGFFITSINKDFLHKIQLMLHTVSCFSYIYHFEQMENMKMLDDYFLNDHYIISIKHNSLINMFKTCLNISSNNLNFLNRGEESLCDEIKNIRYTNDIQDVYFLPNYKSNTVIYNGILVCTS